MMRTRRHCRGAGALVAVLLLAAFAGTALSFHYAAEHRAGREARAQAAGGVFAAWFLAAHRVSQERDFSARLATAPGFVVSPAELRALGTVAPGLPGPAGIGGAVTVGIMTDGNGVAMAFGVLEPDDDGLAAAMQNGALANGLEELAAPHRPGSAIEAHRPTIDTILGRPLLRDAAYVTADAGVRLDDRVLHRRPQPGRPWLNRMETGLDAGGRAVTAGGTATARSARSAGATAASAEVSGSVVARDLSAAELAAGELTSSGLTVTGALVVGQAITGALGAGVVRSTGRLEAASMAASGALTATTLAVSTDTGIAGALSVDGLDGESVTSTGDLSIGSASLQGIYGPHAEIHGAMRVGRCFGC